MGEFDLGKILSKWEAAISCKQRVLLVDSVKLLDNYKGLAIVSIHDGKSYLIWDDLVP